MLFRSLCFLMLCLPAFTHRIHSEVYYRQVPLPELQLTDRTLPDASGASREQNRAYWKQRDRMQIYLRPYMVLEGGGEGYLHQEGLNESNLWSRNNYTATLENTSIVIRLEGKAPSVEGMPFLVNPGWDGLPRLAFKIPYKDEDQENARKAFLKARDSEYAKRIASEPPGSAWFRHQLQLTRAELKDDDEPATPSETATPGPRIPPPDPQSELVRTYSLFPGGRAVSENLQLDRALQVLSHTGDRTVPIDTLDGVTTDEINWKPLIEGKNPGRDALAAYIPHDQHAIFFPSYGAMMNLVREAGHQGAPILHMLEPQAEDALTLQRYQEQLCLQNDQVTNLLGPGLIESSAVTGSDPYLRTGHRHCSPV
jgi:hypothetical protein